MNETFLSFIWKFGLYDKTHLITTDGEQIEVLSPGWQNSDSGPDFFNAQIKIAGTVWAGNIEIHTCSSDWEKHCHNTDKSYDNVILHVVKTNDKTIVRTNGSHIPTLEINYNPRLEETYNNLLTSQSWIPCASTAKQTDLFQIKHFLGRVLVERMEKKTHHINIILETTQNNWNEVFNRLLFRSFGFNVNAEPFEMLAINTPLHVIAKHRNSLLQLEALLFGQAGFLQEASVDEYQQQLQKEYAFLQAKFGLKPIDKSTWKFLRLRPVNFPTVRIAQLTNLLYKSGDLIEKIVAETNVKNLAGLFETETSDYWQTHYVFGKESAKQLKKLGKPSINRILTNLAVPFLFAYGQNTGKDTLSERAFDLLETLPPENNTITEGWQNIGIKAENAFYSQALLQLKQHYCDTKQCLTCAIGKSLLEQHASS